MFAGSSGYGFIAKLADLVGRNKAGKGFITLDKGEKPLPPAKAEGGTLCALSTAGRLLLFPLADMPELAKGRGNKIIDLDKGDELLSMTVNYGNSVTIDGIGRGGKAASVNIEGKELDPCRGQRARKGQPIPAKLKPAGIR